MDQDNDFINKSSSSSCYISDITNIIFGGLSSRFWILRKHFNSMNLMELRNMPFYSWQCITLNMNHRDVHLVILDEKDMDDFIYNIINKLKTVDGRKNTAEPFIN